MIKQNNNVPSYPEGFVPTDDLDGDGKMDEIKVTLKVNTVRADQRDYLDENISSEKKWISTTKMPIVMKRPSDLERRNLKRNKP